MTIPEQHTDRIAAALAETRAIIREENPMAWGIQTTGIGPDIRLCLADDWLLFEAPLDFNARGATAGGAFLPVELLQWNATLPGGAKFGVDACFNLALRAQLPLLEEIDPGPRLLEAWNGLETGIARFHARQDPAPPEPAPAPAAAGPDMGTLAGETGWSFTERQDGRIAFELPSPAGALTATLQARDGGGLRVWVSLAALDELSTPSRHALAVLLLRAGWVLRLARPAFALDGGQTSACLEVVFDSAPLAAELTQALESLAVGVGLAAAEAKLLCEEQTAREYLTVGTWTPREQVNNNNNQQ